MAAGWTATLNGVTLSGGDRPGDGCLITPPDGLGLPGIRNEDVTLVQRDGVRQFRDWYEPRVITLDVVVGGSGCRCPGCGPERARVNRIIQAWRRQCDSVELVLQPPCAPNPLDRTLTGPYGILGRPRRADLTWERGRSGRARLTLRFDAEDHRIYLLDRAGNPGSGVETVTVRPASETSCRSYPRCYPLCYDGSTGQPGTEAVASVWGTECVGPVICLYGGLTDPTVEVVETGRRITYRGTIGEGAPPVCLDTTSGIATQGGADRTHLISGSTSLSLMPGENTIRLVSFNPQDSGYAEVTWRPVVVSA